MITGKARAIAVFPATVYSPADPEAQQWRTSAQVLAAYPMWVVVEERQSFET